MTRADSLQRFNGKPYVSRGDYRHLASENRVTFVPSWRRVLAPVLAKVRVVELFRFLPVDMGDEASIKALLEL